MEKKKNYSAEFINSKDSVKVNLKDPKENVPNPTKTAIKNGPIMSQNDNLEFFKFVNKYGFQVLFIFILFISAAIAF